MCDRRGATIIRAQTFHHLLPYTLPRGYRNTSIHVPRPGMKAMEEGKWRGHWDDAGYPECRVHDNTTSWHGVLATIRWLGCCAITRCDLTRKSHRTKSQQDLNPVHPLNWG